MGAYFDGLQSAKFGPYSFPISAASVECSQRHQVHEYPHTPGGKLEKLGRRVYSIRMTPVFDEDIEKFDAGNGMTLYPEVLDNLQLLFENEKTLQLTIPTLGTVLAFMTTFSRRIVPNLRSGELAELEFVEDMSDKFQLLSTIREGRASMSTKALAVSNLLAILKFESTEQKRQADSLFDKIDNAVNGVLAIQDQAELQLSIVEAKVRTLTGYLSEADRRLEALQHPENWQLLEAVKELWASAHAFEHERALELAANNTFTLPREMTIQEVSQAIFGTTSRSLELLQMNPIDDASAIPAGTEIRSRL